MKQQYRDIDISKDVRMGCDEYSKVGTEDWTPIATGIGNKYVDDHGLSMKYRRPTAQQYIYENAGFTGAFGGFKDLLSRFDDEPLYDEIGNPVSLVMTASSISIMVDMDQHVNLSNLHTRKPAPRMMELNGQQLVAPETEEPEQGTHFYYNYFGAALGASWTYSKLDKGTFKHGIWLKAEHCQAYIDATQKLLFGGDE